MRVRSVVHAVTFVAVAGAALQAALPYPAKHRAALDETKPLVLAVAGVPKVEIVVGSKPCPVAAFAAAELRTFLGQVMGGDVAVVPQPTGSLTAIFVGAQDGLGEDAVDVAALPRDAFVIKAAGNRIVIAGRDDPRVDPRRDLRGIYERATLFGVYEFLERFAGVRFYFPGPVGTVVPAQPDLRIPQADIYEEPDCDQRRVYPGPESRWFEPLDKETATRTRILQSLRSREQTFYIPCCHGLSRRCLAERFGQSHPEWFALLPNGTRDTDMSLPGHHGHLCYRNPGLLDQIYRETEAYLLGKPAESVGMRVKSGAAVYDHNSFQPGYVDLCPQDGLGEAQWCQMPECKRYWDEGKQSELVWGMVVDIAQRLKKNGVPGCVTCFAYSSYRQPPQLELPDNVLVEVCITGPWDDQLAARRQENDELILAWNAKSRSGKVWLWNYMSNYNGAVPEGVPPLSPRLVGQYYSRLAPHIRGAFNESEIGYWLFNYVNYYVFGKMMWNGGTDVEALLAEHHRLLFAAGAPPMATFFDRLERIWTKAFLGEVRETPLGPVRNKRSDREVWEEIFSEAVMAELGGYLTQAEALTANAPQARQRVRFFREAFLGEMLRVRGEYGTRRRGLADQVSAVRPLPAGNEIRLDGRLDEAAWAQAAPLYLVPLQTDRCLTQTAVRLLWTPETLYVGFDCGEPNVERLYLAERRHDDPQIWVDAGVEIFLNPSGDRTHYRHLIVNANGVLTDGAYEIVGGKPAPGDLAWESGARTAASKQAGSWQVEVAIPVAAVAGTAAPLAAGSTWVANLCRSRNITQAGKDENQLYTWSPFVRRSFHDPANFGQIRFVSAEAAPASRLPDAGGFEEELKGRMVGQWYLPQQEGERACFSFPTEYAREGRRSACISNRDTAKPQALHLTQYLPALQPGKRYLLTFWVRAENVQPVPGLTGHMVSHWGGFANVNFGSVKQEGNNLFVPTGGYRESFDWTKAGFELRAPAVFDPDAKPYIRMSLTNATGTVWYDDVRLREIDPVTGTVAE